MKFRKEKKHGQNPYLKATVLEVVQNQFEADDSPEAREAFNRLTSQGITTIDHDIGRFTMFSIMHREVEGLFR